MKALFNLFLALFVSGAALAQDEEPVVQDPAARSRIEAAKAAYISEKLGLTPEEAEKFWPIYHEFAAKRADLRQQYRDAGKSGASEEEMVNLGLTLKQQEVDLEKEYSKKMLESIPAQKLMQLKGAERDFTRLIIQQIQQRKLEQEKRKQLRERQQQQQLQKKK